MCDACKRGDCERCTGCWHETEHDFSDRFDDYDVDDMADRAADAYERALDRMWGDAA